MGADPRARQVELVLGRLTDLPTLSPIAQRLLTISSEDDFDLREVTRLIEADPSTSARILALCRRAELGLGDRITTVKRAILMLGMDAVRSAVLSVSVYDAMQKATADQQHPEEAGGFDRAGFWRHAVGVACCAEMLAREHKAIGVSHDEAFIAGLLHDLGRLALQVALPRAVARVVQLAEHRQCDSAPLERQIIGLDHHLAGRRVAQKWELPEALSNVMWLHGQPSSAVPDVPERNLVCLVTIARQICRQLHIGWSGDFGEGVDFEHEAAELGLVQTRIEKIKPRLHEEVAARCAAIGIGDESSPQLLLQSIQLANERLVRANDLLRERMRTGDRAARAVQAVSGFQRAIRPGLSVDETLHAVLESADRELGAAAFVAAALTREGQFGRLLVRQGEGPLEEFSLAPEMPADAAFAAELRSLGRGPQRIEPPDALLDAAPALLDEPLLARRLLPGQNGRPLAALISPALAALDESMAPLLDAWTLALAWAVEHEQGQNLGERLVEANRALAEAQAQLTRTESLRRLAEMSAGAAHEMNNPLMVISGRAQLLAMRAEGSAREAAAEIVTAAEELTELVTSLNLLANPPRPRRGPTTSRRIAEAALALVGASRGPAEAQRVRIEAGELALSGDERMLAGALAELVLNALDATDGQDVTISAEIDPLDGRWLLRVADRGRGMSPRALEHAFDPFFSEREAGRGRGLGLARAQRLAELHGGEILLRTVAGAGTTATLALPPDAAGRHSRAA